jgi:zinc protease
MTRGLKICYSVLIAMTVHGDVYSDLHSIKKDTMIEQKSNKVRLPRVRKKVLDNGMTILVCEQHQIPKVSVQLWYNVGSKDEQTGERGIAHLIEHMIFKGTEELSESDIDTTTHKLSGSCNAFTSNDYTGYLFNMPKQHWQECLPIMADCMQNAAFKEDMLSSEMKAVIQELKMYKDNYTSSLFEHMLSTIFEDHPYHYPIIGYKQDLWTVNSDRLRAFYKKHYVPNNAALVVVGDVDAQEVFDLAQEYFGDIPANPQYTKAEHYHNRDILSKSVTLYRDIQVPMVGCVFVVPGLSEKKENVMQLLSWVLANGRGSRLYKKLVNDRQLVTAISADTHDLFEYGLFYIFFEPKSMDLVPEIEQCIMDELNSIAHGDISDTELDRAIKQTQMGLYNLLEDYEHQAYQIGKYFWATGDENYVFNYLNQSPDYFKKEMQGIVNRYCRQPVMHKGVILPLPDTEKQMWKEVQQESDEQDNKILQARVRTTEVEEPSYAHSIEVQEPGVFAFSKPHKYTLPNGLTVLYHNNPVTPKIDIVMQFKAKPYFDALDKPGVYNFLCLMLTEGTQHYSSDELAAAIESRGMTFSVYPGGLTMRLLKDDLYFGLEIMQEIVTAPTFPVSHMEKIRDQIVTDIKNYWDDPWTFSSQLIRENVYKGHPYSKNVLGTLSSVANIEREDLVRFFQKYISPAGASMAIVGDLTGYDLESLLTDTLGGWSGAVVEDVPFAAVSPVTSTQIDYPINRDQVVLCFVGCSIDRKHPDYNKLLLFDQIFGGGVLGAMSSRLFQLREQYGLFYTIRGSLLSGVDEQPGMVSVKTIVSLDRLAEAEKVIKEAINSTVGSIEIDELQEAKHAVINSLVDLFASNSSMAQAFLFLHKYGFEPDFFDTRAADLSKVTLDDINKAAAKVLDTNKMLTLRIGRIG